MKSLLHDLLVVALVVGAYFGVWALIALYQVWSDNRTTWYDRVVKKEAERSDDSARD